MTLNVSYRPGPQLAPKIVRLSESWGVNAHQASKRLTALAAIGLTADDHDSVLAVADDLGLSFESACIFAANGDH